MICNDDGGNENLRNSRGRSFHRRGAVYDMARFENLRRVVTVGRERVRHDDERVERVVWMMKSSRRYFGWEYCREL